MGVIEKLKRLHKQTLLKLSDIKRTVIAKEAGVDNEEYLSRARTLNSYLNPNLEEEESGESGSRNQGGASTDQEGSETTTAPEDSTESVDNSDQTVQAQQVSAKSSSASTTTTTASAKKSAKTFKM